MKIGGVNAAAVTPHRKEGHRIDLGAAFELIDFLSAAGVRGIALMGATGEFVHLDEEDRIRLVDMAVKRSRAPIIAGVSHSTLDGAVELGRQACSAGAAALLVMPPHFFRYSQDDVREFYMRFAAGTGAQSIYLYNLPFFTNPIEPQTAVDLLATGRFAGIKDSSGDIDALTKLLEARAQNGKQVLIGNDTIFTRGRRMGADGVISGVACALPELMVALDRAIQSGDEAAVERLEGRLQEFISRIDRLPAPVGINIATAARGLKVGPLSVPLGPANQRIADEFQEWFRGWLPAARKEAVA